MVDWTLAEKPERAIDAGAGSGRFAVAIAADADELDYRIFVQEA